MTTTIVWVWVVGRLLFINFAKKHEEGGRNIIYSSGDIASYYIYGVLAA